MLLAHNIASELKTEAVAKVEKGEIQLGKPGTKKHFLELVDLEKEHLLGLQPGQRDVATMKIDAALAPFKLTLVEYSKLLTVCRLPPLPRPPLPPSVHIGCSSGRRSPLHSRAP